MWRVSGWWLEPSLGVSDADSTAALHETFTHSVTLRLWTLPPGDGGGICHTLSKGRDDLEDHLYKVTTCMQGAGRLHQGWRAPGCEAQSSQVPATGTQLVGSRSLGGLKPDGQCRAGGRDKTRVQAGMGSGPASKPRAWVPGPGAPGSASAFTWTEHHAHGAQRPCGQLGVLTPNPQGQCP